MIKNIKEKDINKLNIKRISFDVSSFSTDDQAHHINRLGSTPLIYFNGAPIDIGYINTFTLSNDSFLPTLKISFNNFNLLHRETTTPLDDSVISFFLKSSIKELKDIRLDFKIKDYDYNTSEERLDSKNNYYFECILDLNSLYLYQYKSYSNKTSYDVLLDLCNETGLGFASNIQSTKDNMTWRNTGYNKIKFIEYITKHAYGGESNFYWSFIDLYYNLTFVDIEKQIRENIDKFKGITDALYNSNYDFPQLNNKLDKNIVLLSNEESYKNSDGYIAKYYIYNQSTNININNAYIREISYYDVKGNQNESAGYMINFFTDSFITPEAEKDKIILKGRIGDNSLYDKHISKTWAGLIDQSNMHKDYLYASMQNESNIIDIQKFYLKVRLQKVNFNIYRFSKVYLYIVTSFSINESYPNKIINGDWLVTGINLIYENSQLYHELILIKRELNAT